MIRTITLAAGLALAACAQAQDAARADAPVPPATYVSPLAGYRAAPAMHGTPAANWVASNAAVAGGGHGMHGMHAAPKQPAAHAGHAKAPAADPHAPHRPKEQQPKAEEHHHEH
ncbi:hypothetical protein [Pseudoduganella armeniaca]|uniref:Uncharacterized protein n=1 Tax=Pseudoduganella armeniaca TaxID=2072590 RepID=A0A2R4CA91_9BURK|nr:hypothetical protein [Pseudoduganella armeniaca]AVR96567.1 hypothetical protein C9I28_13325 [Pseudoduganella armeniaca]